MIRKKMKNNKGKIERNKARDKEKKKKRKKTQI